MIELFVNWFQPNFFVVSKLICEYYLKSMNSRLCGERYCGFEACDRERQGVGSTLVWLEYIVERNFCKLMLENYTN